MSNIRLSASLVTAGIIIGGSAAYAYLTPYEKNIIIKNKYQRVKGGEGWCSHIFMCCDKNNMQYRITNTPWYWQFYSTELWNSLEENQEYHVKGYGIRFGVLGMYPNIYSAEKVISEKN